MSGINRQKLRMPIAMIGMPMGNPFQVCLFVVIPLMNKLMKSLIPKCRTNIRKFSISY